MEAEIAAGRRKWSRDNRREALCVIERSGADQQSRRCAGPRSSVIVEDRNGGSTDDSWYRRRFVSPPECLLRPQIVQDAFREQNVLLKGGQRQCGEMLPL